MHLELLAIAILIAAAPAAAQRGGAAPGGGSPARDCGSNENGPGRGAAGLSRDMPCPPSVEPSAADPEVRAKLDYEKNLSDVARVAQLAKEIREELERAGQSVVPASLVAKSEEMAKVSKRIHDRLKTTYASAPKR
jgi:hypothetical protein